MKTWKFFAPDTDPLIIGLDEKLVDLLDEGRENAGVPFHLTSGRRSAEHNEAVGGVADSAHISGLAADIAIYDGAMLKKALHGLLDAGALRLVIGVRHEAGQTVYHNLHVDIDETKPVGVFVKMYGKVT